MRLSVEWIKEYAPVEMSTDEIAAALTMAGLEVEETGVSEIGDVLDVKVTPNRGDCLSVIGLARELAAGAGIEMKPAPRSVSSPADLPASVQIAAPELCPRYAARVISSIRVGDSPYWMQARLLAAGMRPVNNVVDVTNYVMLEMGQPLHAFDYDRLAGRSIIVRQAREGEAIRTLDGVDRALDTDMLMICDAERPVAVAGVMGGAESEVTPATTTILLESAHFDPLSVRRTARRLQLRTEASYRFERVVDPGIVAAAADRCCRLLEEIGAGEPLPGIIDCYPGRKPLPTLTLRPERTAEMLGFAVAAPQMVQSLRLLGFNVEPDAESFRVTAPSWRPDVVREIDLIEEVGRVVGYGNIPERLPGGASTQGRDTEESRFAGRVRTILAGAGLQEVVTHTLMPRDAPAEQTRASQRVILRNSLSERLWALRTSLIPSLMETLDLNARSGNAPLAFFEVGTTFSRERAECREELAAAAILCGPLTGSGWQRDERPAPADYFLARGIAELLCSRLQTPEPRFEPLEDPRFHPGRSAAIVIGDAEAGVVGELHPRLAATVRVRDRIVAIELNMSAMMRASGSARRYAAVSPYPSVSRDLAPRIDDSVPYATVREAILSAAPAILERFELTDVYTGPPLEQNQKSLTLTFTFRAPDRTLTDEEVNAAIERLRSSLASACGATFVG